MDIRGGGIGGTSTFNGQVKIVANPKGKGYTLTDTRSFVVGNGSSAVTSSGASVSFDANDRTSTAGYFDVYTKQSGSVTDQLKIYANVRGRGILEVPPVALSYTSFGYWTHTDTAMNEIRQTYLVFGSPTDTMPLSGKASYNTLLIADAAVLRGSDNVYMMGVNGTASFDVDFGTGSVTTLLDLTRASDNGEIGSLLGIGNISDDSRFGGTFTSTAPHFSSGYFLGSFFGPSAKEMGYAFDLIFYDDGLGGASYRPVTLTEINGAVVGTSKH